MKATELRIGNWVYDAQCEMNVQIGTGLHIDNLDPLSKPIPLTEEWLLRFGAKFELVENYYRYFILDSDKWQHYHITKAMPNMIENNLWSFIVRNNEGKSYRLYSIKHVHHFQNLYFSLTGEELTIKEDERIPQ